jgi:phytanoyl-CoA hydroxylase
MIKLKTPRGLDVDVPEVPAEDKSARFTPSDADGIKHYYEENGYVIIQGLFDVKPCEEIRALWNLEVKPFDGFMYRQATAKAERHAVNANGWVMNPILNLQSVDPRRFPRFRAFATDKILSGDGLNRAFRTLLGEAPKVVQSMYFEGNSATWEHQDSYYLDSEKVGEMTAAWIAIEDISPRAGRFFVCPRSHLLKLDEHSIENNIAENHEQYIQSVVAKIREQGLEIRAPILNKGDVLFWNAWTIHGSLDSQDAVSSRSSITCHAIPRSRKFLQLQMRVLDVPTEEVNGTAIFRPKNLAIARNRMIMFLESHFPAFFYFAKRKAIGFFLRRKAMPRRHLATAA